VVVAYFAIKRLRPTLAECFTAVSTVPSATVSSAFSAPYPVAGIVGAYLGMRGN